MEKHIENGWELWEIDMGGIKEWIATHAAEAFTPEQVLAAYRDTTDMSEMDTEDAEVTHVEDLDTLEFVEVDEKGQPKRPARQSLAELTPAHKDNKGGAMIVATTEW